MIRMVPLTGNEMMAFVDSDAYLDLPVVPISRRRAISQYHNPRRSKSDVVLLLAYDDEVMVGYLGAVPDQLTVAGEDPLHIGWLSCIWVSPQARGKGVALKLVKRMAEEWAHRLVLTEYVPAIKVLYDRSGIFDEEPRLAVGIRRFYRSCLHTVLPQRSAIAARCVLALRMADKMCNFLLDSRRTRLKPPRSTLTVRHTRDVDQEVTRFIDQHCTRGLFARDGRSVDWALSYPWLRSGKPDQQEERYYFTSAVDRWESEVVTFHDELNLVAVVIITIRDDHMRVPLAYCGEYFHEVATYLDYWAAYRGVDRLTVYHGGLCTAMRRASHRALHQRDTTRSYLLSKSLPQIQWSSYDIQDGDGDAFFT